MIDRKTLLITVVVVLVVATYLLYSNKSCPPCDDGNPCTEELCDRETGYTCVSMKLSGPQGGCNAVSADCMKSFCDSGVCSNETALNCCGNNFCEKGESKISCPSDCKRSCPDSCEDGNNCTRDYCGVTTDFKCAHEKILSPECNTSCPISCDDSDNCTEDFCSEETEFKCSHRVIYPCCGDHVCDTIEKFSCVVDCPMREEKLIELPRFKGTDAADWIYPYKKEFVLQTHTENITFDVRCSKKFKNESTGFLLPYITESKLMGRFLKDTGDVSFNGYIECASGRCNVNPDYSKEENVGTRILNASQGARVRVYFYIALKEAFFYDFDVDGRKPKEIARIACNLSVFSASPPQSINESFKLEFKPTCDDRIKDQGEDEVDCGGPCPQCKCRKDENCGRSEWVGKMYCWDAFSVMARRFKFVSCEKPLYDQPFCNSTIVQKSLNYPCIEKGYY